MHRRQILKISAASAATLAATPLCRAAEAGVTDAEVVLGHTGILTGPLGANIKAMLAGANLAFQHSNGRGGVSGRKLRIVSRDDELKPDKAVANYEKLLADDRVFAFFGCVGSGTTAAAAPVLKASGAPMIGGYAVADSAREKVRGSAYFARATTGREAQALVRHLTTIGMTQIAVVHLDNPGGLEALALVKTALAEYKLDAHGSAGIKGDGSNIAEAARKIADPKVHAVVMYLGGTLAAELMKAMWALDSRPKFYGMSIVPGEASAKVLGDKVRGLAISQVVPYPWAPIEPLAVEFRRLAAAGNVNLDYYAYEGFLNAQMMLEGLSRCGRDLSRSKLHQAMRQLKMPLAGLNLDFSTGHTGSRFVELVQVTLNGQFLR